MKNTKNTNRQKSYKENALDLFKLKLGESVTSEELAQIGGVRGKPISHNIRRVFELRDEQGYNIVNHKDNENTGLNLKVNEWVLLDSSPDPKKIRPRGVNKRIMFEVFTRDGFRCQFCGLTPKDDDPFKSGHKIKLHVGHIIAHKRQNRKDVVKVEAIKNIEENHELTKDDFITMCNVCNEGAKNKDLQIATLADEVINSEYAIQKEIFELLKKKFN